MKHYLLCEQFCLSHLNRYHQQRLVNNKSHDPTLLTSLVCVRLREPQWQRLQTVCLRSDQRDEGFCVWCLTSSSLHWLSDHLSLSPSRSNTAPLPPPLPGRLSGKALVGRRGCCCRTSGPKALQRCRSSCCSALAFWQQSDWSMCWCLFTPRTLVSTWKQRNCWKEKRDSDLSYFTKLITNKI